MKLTDAAIARLRPREREYTVWDTRVAGLGVRVRPSGGRSYVLLQEIGGRSKRTSLGSIDLRRLEDVRRECHARQAAPKPEERPAPMHTVPVFQDFVAGPWKQAHFNSYKPSTKRTAQHEVARQLLPAFGTSPLDRISEAAIRRWFERYSRTAPGGANHALARLRQILNFAIACGHIETNPAAAIAFNRRLRPTRFLSRDELRRLHVALNQHACGKSGTQQADIIRLLLFTGCRKGEIIGLRWSEVRDAALVLDDSKTGPRTVQLNRQARSVLDRQPRTGSRFVFPSPLNPSCPRSTDLPLWNRVRRETGTEDVRLHDLRHTMASHAVMNGVPVPVVSRLLGHSNVQMTLRYAHLADPDVEAAAERIGQAMAQLMGRQIPSGKAP